MKRIQVFLVLIAITFTFLSEGNAQVLEAPPRDGVFDKSAIMELQPIPYIYLREADIVWTKRIWRTIDMRERMNQPFYYPLTPQNEWRSLIDVLLDGIREGTLTAYSSSVDQFTIPITYKELSETLTRTISQRIPDPNNPGMFIDTSYVQEFNPESVKLLRLKEDWYFDKQRSVMEVRILGICPVGELRDPNTNEYLGPLPLFWVYFPECRDVFAKKEVFNLMNGSAGRLSYDDAFTKRIFSSYIYKAENVYDRRIDEYATGLDAMLESEKIKNEIFEFEEGLWEF